MYIKQYNSDHGFYISMMFPKAYGYAIISQSISRPGKPGFSRIFMALSFYIWSVKGEPNSLTPAFKKAFSFIVHSGAAGSPGKRPSNPCCHKRRTGVSHQRYISIRWPGGSTISQWEVMHAACVECFSTCGSRTPGGTPGVLQVVGFYCWNRYTFNNRKNN